jgi:transcriptional regulator
MYLPKHFQVADRAWCHALIQAESFGMLAGVDEAGAPFATHLPFLLDEDRGRLGTLLGHVARANPQWRYFRPDRPVLAIFSGPHAYVSPAWYEDVVGSRPRPEPASREQTRADGRGPASVPTWNYVAVHAFGVPSLIEEPVRVRAFLARLVRVHEAGRSDRWSFESLPEDYLAGMLKGIVAFEIPIDRLEGKAKLSQNRTAADRARVRAALEAAGDRLAAAVAALMADGPPG